MAKKIFVDTERLNQESQARETADTNLGNQISILSGKIEWKPNNWKTETDAPNTYPLGSVTRFNNLDVAWDGTKAWRSIETRISSSYGAGGCTQMMFGFDNALISYRNGNGSGTAWGKWLTIATTEKIAISPTWLKNKWALLSGGISKTGDVISITCVLQTGVFTKGTIIMSLPNGYKPITGIDLEAVGRSSTDVTKSLFTLDRATGNLLVNQFVDARNIYQYSFNLSYRVN